MATISRIKRKKGVVYRVRIRRVGHDSISQVFDRQSDAVRWAEDTEKALDAGGYIGDAPPGDMAFKTALDRYLVEISTEKKINTKQREETSSGHLHKFFDGYTLGTISPEMVAKFRDTRLKTVKPSTLQKDLALLSHLYTIAVTEWSMPVTNPVQKIRKPKVGRGRVRMLEQAEIIRLLDACKKSKNKKLHSYVLLQLYTGMRPSEGAGLIWKKIDLDKRIIDLTETKNDPRRVPLTVSAVEILANIMPEKDCSPEDYVFVPETISLRVKRRPNLYYRRSYDNAVKAAKIEDFTMHDLRHTAATWLLMCGADFRTIADILGHKTMEMVMKYTHILDGYKLDTIDKIDGLF